jgi:hypothetical protein
LAAVAVNSAPVATINDDVPGVPVNVTVFEFVIVTTALPKLPVNSISAPVTHAAVTAVVVRLLRSAASVDCSAVTAVVPAPVEVFAVKSDAGPVSVEPFSTANVAVPMVAPSSVRVFEPLIVTTALPKSPVNVPLSENADVTTVVARLLRSAASVE